MIRAVYEQVNNFGVADRLEIHDNQFSGDPITLTGRFPLAFDFEHRETTSQQREYLSIFENQIIMGVMDLFLKIDTPEKETLINDIADSPNVRFLLNWKKDSVIVWKGRPYGRIVDFLDVPNYNVNIQFRDFESLKSRNYPLNDGNQKSITVQTEILSRHYILSSDEPIRTATSWQTEETNLSDDFLNQVYINRTVLREPAGNGFPMDRQITDFEALQRTLEPMLILYQWRGYNFYQISALKNSESVQIAEYSGAGALGISVENIRQQVFTKKELGTPSGKVSSRNTSFPPIRKASYEFLHRSGGAEFDFPLNPNIAFRDEVDFGDERTVSDSIDFSGSGDEKISFRGAYESIKEEDEAPFGIRAGSYILDSDFSWKRPVDHNGIGEVGFDFNDTNGEISIRTPTAGQGPGIFNVGDPVMFEPTEDAFNVLGDLPGNFSESQVYYILEIDEGEGWIKVSRSPSGNLLTPSDKGDGIFVVRNITLFRNADPVFDGLSNLFRAVVIFQSEDIPVIENNSVEVVLVRNQTDSSEHWFNMFVTFQNPTAAGESIEYIAEQSQQYPDELRLRDSYFGTGPFLFSKSAYRTSFDTGDITKKWRRRGETSFVPYSQLKLREVMDYQRVRQLKKEFEIFGEIDPTNVIRFDSDDFMYVGGSYNGRWRPVTVKIREVLDE
jgi:hypothetical protein